MGNKRPSSYINLSSLAYWAKCFPSLDAQTFKTHNEKIYIIFKTELIVITENLNFASNSGKDEAFKCVIIVDSESNLMNKLSLTECRTIDVFHNMPRQLNE